MGASLRQRTRSLTVLAQDPSFGARGRVVTTELRVPTERFAPGPKGHRVHVIDYDASTGKHYSPLRLPARDDPYKGVDARDELLADPQFHAQNVYAIVMATLGRFEGALGRHVGWGFTSGAHHIKVAPHGFAEANAFYSRRDEALMFGYFADERGEPAFTCLSHDIVVHEASHALLDGLRPDFIRPSSSDQEAFHEGFSDLIALLAVLCNEEVVEEALRRQPDGRLRGTMIPAALLERDRIARSVLLGLARQMGRALGSRANALRRSVNLEQTRGKPRRQEDEDFGPHERGELLVAAVMNAYLDVWRGRLVGLGLRAGQSVRLERVAEEAADAAQHLMKISIRALDATPPVDLEFGDFLSALLTNDFELYPDDSKYGYRAILRRRFADYGIEPAAVGKREPGTWDVPKKAVTFGSVHSEPMRWDPEEMASFLWENRKPLELSADAFLRVRSVRPVVRTGLDGHVLRETVAEYIQILDVRAAELKRWKIRKPRGMPDGQTVRLRGGGTLLFDEFGRLKLHVGTGVCSRKQSKRLHAMFEAGYFQESWGVERHFASLHRARLLHERQKASEGW